MTVIIGENKQQPNKTFYQKRLITCPGHWLVNPTVDVYLRKPIEMFKNCSDFVEIKGHRINLKKTKIVRDRMGNKVIDWKKLYALRKTGKVIHPKVSAAWAIENVYDPISLLCYHCDKRCKEGQGRVLTRTIKRLSR